VPDSLKEKMALLVVGRDGRVQQGLFNKEINVLQLGFAVDTTTIH
jgi:hypothetical protein